MVNKQDFIRVESKLIQGENGYNIASDSFKKVLDIEALCQREVDGIQRIAITADGVEND